MGSLILKDIYNVEGNGWNDLIKIENGKELDYEQLLEKAVEILHNNKARNVTAKDIEIYNVTYYK